VTLPRGTKILQDTGPSSGERFGELMTARRVPLASSDDRGLADACAMGLVASRFLNQSTRSILLPAAEPSEPASSTN
jgi:hypothetical protein